MHELSDGRHHLHSADIYLYNRNMNKPTHIPRTVEVTEGDKENMNLAAVIYS